MLLALVSLVGCDGSINRKYPAPDGDSVLRTDTIEKSNCTLAYTYPVEALSYGDNGLILLDLSFPMGFVPELRLPGDDMGAIMENGSILEIAQDDPVVLSDGSTTMSIRISFEAFLPGTAIFGPFSIDFHRPDEESESRVVIEVDPIEFVFNGDPSLMDIDAEQGEPPELAGLISPPEKPAPIRLLPFAVVLLVITGGALFAFLPRKKPEIQPADKDYMLTKFREQFEGQFFDVVGQDDLRAAYEILSRAIMWAPHLGGNPEIRTKLLAECAKIRFSGRPAAGERAEQRLRTLYRVIAEDGKR